MVKNAYPCLRKAIRNFASKAFISTAPGSRKNVIGYKYLGPSIPYSSGLALQERLVAQHTGTNILLLLQHPPTYTAGRRVRGTDVAEGKRLRELGADYFETLRGGQTTFHGPGQLVGYPILDLRPLGLGVRNYVKSLERFLILTCKHHNVIAATTEDTGVWVKDRKIAALGIQVRKHITSHGFALNCNTDLSWYEHIIPCGLPDKGVTSITRELSLENDPDLRREVTVDEIIPSAIDAFATAFGADLRPLEELSRKLDQDIDPFLHNA